MKLRTQGLLFAACIAVVVCFRGAYASDSQSNLILQEQHNSDSSQKFFAAAIANQIYKCVNYPIAASEKGYSVTLHLVYRPNGTAEKIDLFKDDLERMGKDKFFKAFVDSAARAVKRCPIGNMPNGSFPQWQYSNIHFSNKDEQ